MARLPELKKGYPLPSLNSSSITGLSEGPTNLAATQYLDYHTCQQYSAAGQRGFPVF